jgi:hypothetical protein
MKNFLTSLLFAITLVSSTLCALKYERTHIHQSIQKRLNQRYSFIDDSNPIHSVDENGIISEKPFQFNPDFWTLRIIVQNEYGDSKKCFLQIEYDSAVPLKLVSKENKNDDSKTLKNGDLYMLIKKGKNIFHNVKISSTKEDDLCEEEMEISGIENILGREVVYKNLFRQENENLSEDSLILLQFYPFKLENTDLKKIKNLIEVENNTVGTKISEIIDEQNLKKIEYTNYNDFIDRFEDDFNNNVDNFFKSLETYCEKNGYTSGNLFYLFFNISQWVFLVNHKIFSKYFWVWLYST